MKYPAPFDRDGVYRHDSVVVRHDRRCNGVAETAAILLFFAYFVLLMLPSFSISRDERVEAALTERAICTRETTGNGNGNVEIGNAAAREVLEGTCRDGEWQD